MKFIYNLGLNLVLAANPFLNIHYGLTIVLISLPIGFVMIALNPELAKPDPPRQRYVMQRSELKDCKVYELNDTRSKVLETVSGMYDVYTWAPGANNLTNDWYKIDGGWVNCL